MYQFKDHLGNIRLSYKDANKDGSISTSEIVEVKDYYPFGMRINYGVDHPNSMVNGRKHNYGFNGIEYEEGLSLNFYEMDLRQYDPAIARWTAIDPVTHWDTSTYNGFDNNPVFWADPSGASVEQIEGGIRYTGVDAQLVFSQLQKQFGGNNNEDSGDNDEENNDTSIEFSDPLSSNNNMTISDPKEDIRKYEENDRIIVRNSMILDALGKLTNTGQLKSTMMMTIEEWRKSTGIVINRTEAEQMLADIDEAFTGLGITVTTAVPQVKIAAAIISTSLMTETIYRDTLNTHVYAPRIKEHSRDYYHHNIQSIPYYSVGGPPPYSIGGGGAGGTWD